MTFYPPQWNKDYDFESPANKAEIQLVEAYDLECDTHLYTAGGEISSPWGRNTVVSVGAENGEEICIKEITVNPGFMLSLQRHRGRAELWEVLTGTLGVIHDGKYLDIPAGQSIALPRGCVHCMINTTQHPVTVRETQRGICREKDNIRLMDFNDRATYPLMNEIEYNSALLYRDIMEKLKRR